MREVSHVVPAEAGPAVGGELLQRALGKVAGGGKEGRGVERCRGETSTTYEAEDMLEMLRHLYCFISR